MTVVVAITVPDPEPHIAMTGDRNAVAEDYKQHRKDLKIFTNGQFVLSTPESWRAGQVIQYAKLPQPKPIVLTSFERIFCFMVRQFIPAVIDSLLTAGCLSHDQPYDLESEFLAAVGPWLFEIGRDFQVASPTDHFSAIGSGSEYALAVLHSSNLSPVHRLYKAVSTASHFVTGISPDCSPVFKTLTNSQYLVKSVSKSMTIRQIARRIKRSPRYVYSVASGASVFTSEEKKTLWACLEKEA